ncbi:MAG: YtxH domain-containing protein [Gemmatimonadales bacterium]
MARDPEDDREIVLVERDGGSRLGPIILGLALGVGLGLLFAPQSGEETRRGLRRRWRRLRAAAEDQAELFGERLTEGVDRLRSGAWLEDDDDEEDDLEAERPPAGRSAPGSAREELERRLSRSRARRRPSGKPPSGQEPVA